MSEYVPNMGDIVKLGRTAQEAHTVIGSGGRGYVQVRQHTTGKVRIVRASRVVVLRAADPEIQTREENP